ncbi:MAG: type I glutamate--ammonia ligase [Cardiobacteriaceae bacterium]|nr:type I glutamate--ammonia ligase [Cardiobacteriaceae bacterium]
MTVTEILELIEEGSVRYLDLRLTDTLGKEHHITYPAQGIDEDFFEEGKMFDGSSFAGWRGVQNSDMILMPDPQSAYLDPFYHHETLVMNCTVIEPDTLQAYTRDPRSIALRAEQFLKSTGLADTVLFGPENEFFIFDEVKFQTQMHQVGFEIVTREGFWNSAKDYDDFHGNTGHRPRLKGGYLPVAPVDSLHDIRAEMCEVLEEVGQVVEVQHHEVATGQCEIGCRFNTLVRKADEVQQLKYVIHNVAHRNGKTATFMPKPIVGDNGSGMHVHMSFVKDGKNLFMGDQYGGLSELALYYIGGIIKHAHALNAFTNPAINSYKRLVPHFEAPVMLAYSARNRSASIRIPYTTNPKARRIEVRFPDSSANPYLAFAALLMAGLDGIKNKIHPGDAMDKDLYDLPPEEADNIPQVAFSLEQALNALDKDRAFLTQGGVFSDDFIDSYLSLKRQEVDLFRVQVHPLEFQMYYSC